MKKLLAILLASTMIIGLAGCGSSGGGAEQSTSAATTENADKDTLYINLASEPDFLDPTLNSSVDGACLAVNSFEGLYTYNEKQEIVPAIAEALPEVSEDGCTYTVKLKDTVWSNGEKLTANDFVYSWNRAVDPATAADYAYLFDIIDRDDDKLDVKAVDDYTLEIKLTNPCPYFLSLLAFPVFFPVYQADVEKANPDGTKPGAWAQEAGFVSNGAYTLTEWKHNESMVYTKNDNYWNADKVNIPTLNFMLSADNTATYAAYNSGDLDFIDSVPTDEIQSLLNNKEFKIIDNLGTYYLAFNVNSDLFKDMTPEQGDKFREAISLMIDRQYIVDAVGQTGQVPADSYIPAGMSDGNGGIFKGEDTSYYDATTTGPSNAEQAMKLLEECGYSFTDNGDGTYSVSPAITIPYILNQDDGHQKVAESIQSDLSTIGIEITIAQEDWNVFLQDRKDGKYTFAREGWLADYDDPINMLEMFTTDSGNNDPQLGRDADKDKHNWKEYDALIKDIRTTTDFASRVDKMHKAEDILMSTYAVIPIYYYNDIYMQKGNVDGIYSTVTGNKYFMYATKK